MITIDAVPAPIALDPARTALVMIDMQRDFLEPGGFGEALGNDVTLLSAAVGPCKALLDRARGAGMLVVHTREGHRPDLADAPPAKVARGAPSRRIGDPGPMGRILVRGEIGHDIVPALYPQAGEPVVDKPGKGAFYATDLQSILRNRDIETLIVCGVTTEVWVHTTVREANDRGYRCIVPGDCCGSYFPEFHEMGLRMISAQGGFGAGAGRPGGRTMKTTMMTTTPAIWTPGDWNAFFGFGTNILVNLLVLTGLLRFVLKMPDAIVFGRILPATGLMLCLSTLYYAWLAYRLAKQTGRDDVCALPSGISVPHMFVVTFVIMLPIAIKTGDPIKGWEAGLTWVFVQSFVLMAGGFIGPVIRRITPRPALLGTLAGVSIAFISMRPAMEMFMTPVIGVLCFAVILASWFGGVRYLDGVPAGLVAIAVGTALAWVSTAFGYGWGGMSVEKLSASLSNFGFSVPLPAVGHVFGGFEYLGVILVTAIPFGIYDLVEALDNVESAAVAGDSFPTTRVLTADGVVSLIGCLMGNPFINAVYIGHPGWKAMGGRIGYSAATGVVVIPLAWFGIISVMSALIPVIAISPILLYIGMLIGAQAFQETPKAHAPGIVLALTPNLAAWGKLLIDNSLGAAGTSAAALGHDKLAQVGVLYDGLAILGGGAILGGLVLGAMAAFIVDRDFTKAAGFAGVGAALTFFGFMHGEAIGIARTPMVALAYLLVAGWLFACAKYSTVTKASPARELPIAVPAD